MKVDAKRVVFTVITLATLYVLWHNERFVVQAEHPAWQRYESFKWWLLPHAVFGSIVLLFAPFQFSNRLRQRLPKLHRFMGRMYVLGVFVLAPTGAYIQYFQERGGAPRSFTILAIVDAVLLIGTTTLAGFFAFKRKIAHHRQWATRSYAVALVFIGGRFFMGITGAETMGVEIVQAVIWTCLVAAVPLADVALNWYDIRAAVSKSSKRVATANAGIPERMPRAA
jgi:uncharacterized membrane protein